MDSKEPPLAVVVVGRRWGRRHPYGQKMYTQISYIGLSELEARIADRSIGIQAMRVLVSMLESSDYDNEVRVGHKDLVRVLKMDAADVSKAMRALVECGFIEKPETTRGRYLISPRLAWKGGEDSLREALAKRGMLDEKGVLRGVAA